MPCQHASMIQCKHEDQNNATWSCNGGAKPWRADLSPSQNSDQKVSKMVNKHSRQHASQRGPKLRHKQGAFYYNHHDHSWHGLSDQKQMFNAAKYTQKPADMAAPKCLKHTSMHNAHFKAQNYNTLKHGKGHKWQYKTTLHGLKYDLK